MSYFYLPTFRYNAVSNVTKDSNMWISGTTGIPRLCECSTMFTKRDTILASCIYHQVSVAILFIYQSLNYSRRLQLHCMTCVEYT